MTTMSLELTIRLPRPHAQQRAFIDSTAKRRVIRAGRRGGKTVGVAILAVKSFLQGRRVLYATPTSDQIQRFWFEVTNALAKPIESGVFKKNETEHSIVLPGTEQRIRAKTAWNADTLRGDYADLLILDEWQMMNEDAWELVGAPMLLDNNGDAVFIYTPPSLRTSGVSKARDKRHAAKLFVQAQADKTGRWAVFHFSSHDNPHLNRLALEEITQDMSGIAYRQEILAEDVDELPGALWTRDTLDAGRVATVPELVRVVVGVDPAVTAGEDSNETGIMVVGTDERGHVYVLEDGSLRGSPAAWAKRAVELYDRHRADRIVAEVNQGGEMVEHTVATAARDMAEAGQRLARSAAFRRVHATRGKFTRAEPVSALYEQIGRAHV